MNLKEFKRITQMKKLGLSDELVVSMILQAGIEDLRLAGPDRTLLNDHLTHAAHLIVRFFNEKKEN